MEYFNDVLHSADSVLITLATVIHEGREHNH